VVFRSFNPKCTLAPFIFIYLMKLDDRKFKRNFLILILVILFLKYLNYVIVGNFDDRTMLGNIGLFIIGGYINKFPIILNISL